MDKDKETLYEINPGEVDKMCDTVCVCTRRRKNGKYAFFCLFFSFFFSRGGVDGERGEISVGRFI